MPTIETYKFIGNIFAEVIIIATIKNILPVHLIYQDRSPFGVIFLYTLLEFNCLIFSSSFSLIGSIVIIHFYINLIATNQPNTFTIVKYPTNIVGHASLLRQFEYTAVKLPMK